MIDTEGYSGIEIPVGLFRTEDDERLFLEAAGE